MAEPADVGREARDANPTLLAAWSAIGLATAATEGSYEPWTVIVLAASVLLIVVTITKRLVPARAPSAVNGATLAVGAVVAAAALLPAGTYGSSTDLALSRSLTAVAAVLVAAWVIFRLPQGRLVAYAVVAIMTGAGVALLLLSHRPLIDTWYMLQAASHGLSHGHNIYSVRWTSPHPGEASNIFTYLPGAAVLLWPFHAAFGDVRYGLLTAMALTAVILIRASRGSDGALIACLFFLYPRFLFGLEQSWIDPLSLLAVSLTGYAVLRGRRGWAVVAFAVFLSCKQYNWLLVPFAVLWKDFGWRRTALSIGGAVAFILPWYFQNMHAFIQGAVSYNLDLHLRSDSLSLYTTIVRHGHNPGLWLPAAGIVAVIVLSVWRLPRDTFGFFLGSAAVISAYDLLNRLSFYDGWELAGGLTLFAVVFGRSCLDGGRRADQEADPARSFWARVSEPAPGSSPTGSVP